MNQIIHERIVAMMKHSSLSNGFQAMILMETLTIDRGIPKSRQIAQILYIVFNELTMHKGTHCPIKFRQVACADLTSSLDGPTQHTQLAT